MTFTITVARPAGQDQYGNPLPPSTHTEDGCWVAPAGTGTETHDQESIVEWDLDLFTPPTADIRSEDVITGIPGDTTRYQLHGRPARWVAPTEWHPGNVHRLKGVEG